MKQPPSGGCVLKRPIKALSVSDGKAATFGWLCVETDVADLAQRGTAAATFGWLCVETFCLATIALMLLQPPSGGCVLKHLLPMPA